MNNKEWKAHHKDALAKRFNELPEYEHLKDHADYKHYEKINRLDVLKKKLKKSEKDLNLLGSSASNIV
tara:strand:- start:142 stop:345 length:204 start_codon:yes stop_codon:yes gene_type:complete